MSRSTRLNGRVGSVDLAVKPTVKLDGAPLALLDLSSSPVGAADVGAFTIAQTNAAIQAAIQTAFSSVYPVAAPVVAGVIAVGQTVTGSNGTWSVTPDSYTYQWLRNGSAISGATSASYPVVSADSGTTLTVRVTAKKAGYTDGVNTSVGATVASGTTTVTNIAVNPRVATGTSGWSRFQGTGGTAAASQVATGGPTTDAPSFYRVTWSVAATGGSAGIGYQNAVAASTAYYFAVWARASFAGAKVNLQADWSDSSFSYLASTQLVGGATLTQNGWTRYEGFATSPAGAAYGQLLLLRGGSGVYPPVGATLDMSGIMAVAGSTAYPYRDGGSSGWSWAGTAHASTSTGPIANGATT